MDLLTVNDRPGTYPGSSYAAHMDLPAPFSPATGTVSADYCVIGGGYTGLSAALHLARSGHEVIVLEAQRVAFGASGRNGGQVGSGQRRDQDWLEERLGAGRAAQLWTIAQDAVALVRKLAAEAGVAFHPGIIHADHRARLVGESRAYAEKLAQRYGHHQIRALDRAEIGSLIGTNAYFGGTLDLASGHLDPLRYGLGLARLAVAAGARIHEASRVTSILRGARCTVKTDQAEIRARHVIVACNGYLGGLEPEVAARVMPINNFIIATERLDEPARRAILAENYAVADSKFVINYFRFSDDDRLLFGGTESYGYRFPRDIIAKVRRPMLAIFPQLGETRIEHAWGGTLGITMNRMPHFARLAGNIVSVSGFSGHGVAMATMGGQIAAEAMAGQAERFDIMASVPTPRFPGGSAMRWPLLVLAMVWFQLRDRL